jgi:hypothetical protein
MMDTEKYVSQIKTGMNLMGLEFEKTYPIPLRLM